MNYRFLFIFLLMQISLFAQEVISYENKAFKFYKDSIFSTSKYDKVYLVKKILDQYSYFNVECLTEFNFILGDTVARICHISKSKKLKGKSKNMKIISNIKRNKYPMIFVSGTIINKENQSYFNAITEKNEEEILSYIFEMNKDGEIIKWCNGKLLY